MYNNLFIHNLTLSRRTKTGTNSLGEPEYSETNVYTNTPARFENYDGNTQYRPSGERGVNSNIIYVPPTVIAQLQDKAYWDGAYYGLVIGINPGILGSSTAIDHYELIIERP